jgi:hypothetical protein
LREREKGRKRDRDRQTERERDREGEITLSVLIKFEELDRNTFSINLITISCPQHTF